jgi:hypothetical protein
MDAAQEAFARCLLQKAPSFLGYRNDDVASVDLLKACSREVADDIKACFSEGFNEAGCIADTVHAAGVAIRNERLVQSLLPPGAK